MKKELSYQRAYDFKYIPYINELYENTANVFINRIQSALKRNLTKDEIKTLDIKLEYCEPKLEFYFNCTIIVNERDYCKVESFINKNDI